jgi:pimeloyl-ACP methyl ester carboxylesterase
VVRLGGRREIGYAEYGPATGRPLLWFHGTPGARRQIAPEMREAASERGVRLIAVERPGIGDSTPCLYSAVVDSASDVERICNALGVGDFAVAGLSGGGSYALACAHEMPERVVAAAVLGGVAPAVGEDAADGGLFSLTRFLSPVFRRRYTKSGARLQRLVRLIAPFADEATELFASFMPPGDQRLFEDWAVREMFQDDLITGSRRFMHAVLLDVVVFGRPWGFSLRDILIPVYLWYGDADTIVPTAHGQHLAKRIPRAVLRIRPGEGHLGGLGATSEIFDAVLEHWRDK